MFKNLMVLSVVLLATLFTGDARAADDALAWERDVDKAFERAKKEDKLVFVDVYADWCGPCRMMDANTFSNEEVRTLLAEKFVILKVDADANLDAAQEFGTGSLPTLTVLTADRAPIVKEPGYHPPEEFMELLENAEEQIGALAKLEEELKSDPDNAEKVLELGTKYMTLSRGTDALRVFKSASDSAIGTLPEEKKPEFAFVYALAHVSGDEFEKGSALLDQFVKDFPDDERADRAGRIASESLYLAGKAALEAGDSTKAIEMFEKVSALSSDFPQLAMRAEAEISLAKLMNAPAPELAVDEWLGDVTPSLESLRGKVVLVDFFQIICPGCKRAKPLIEDLQAKYADKGLEVIGIATAFENLESQQKDAIKSYVAQNDFKWPVGVDVDLSETFTRYAAMGSPWTVLIDREGKIRHADFFDPAEVEAEIKKLI